MKEFSIMIVLAIILSAVRATAQSPGGNTMDTKQLELLNALQGEWRLDEYNENGDKDEYKRGFYADAKFGRDVETGEYYFDFSQTVPRREVKVRFKIEDVNVDDCLVLMVHLSDGKPSGVRNWAKVEAERIIVSFPSDHWSVPPELPKQFKPKLGYGLLIWSRIPNSQEGADKSSTVN